MEGCIDEHFGDVPMCGGTVCVCVCVCRDLQVCRGRGEGKGMLMSPDQPGGRRLPVVCGFLISCRKDSTIRVQMILRVLY